MNENDNPTPNPEMNGESPNLEEQLNEEPENSETQFPEMQDALQSETQPSEVKNETDDNQEVAETESKETKKEKPKKKKKGLLVTLIVLFVLVAGAGIGLTLFSLKPEENLSVKNADTEKPEEKEEKEKTKELEKRDIAIAGNDLDEFDLHFLKAEDEINEGNKNIVYSPLSIKYALTMLNEGANGESKAQIEKVLGSYYFKPYTNSANLSLANAFFVNSAKKDKIKETYSLNLKNNFNAELLFDDFASPDNINSWVSNKTFDLVKDIVKKDDVDPSLTYFALVNTLAIDMEWVNEIQLTRETAREQNKTPYSVSFEYESAGNGAGFYGDDYVVFPNKNRYSASRVAATANKYDIIKELGEDGIRLKVQEEYENWTKNEDTIRFCTEEQIKESAPDLDEYVNTLSQHYGHLSSSTDFRFLDNDKVKVFAKDLKTYDGTTLEYIGIMPKEKELNKFIETTSASDINATLKELKEINLDSFKDGVVTELYGSIPLFDFDYDLKLIDDLKALGIEDVFDNIKADLTGITDDSGRPQKPDENVYIRTALHKANIDFSNSGIKAGAATVLSGGGLGAGGCWLFHYSFEVPAERIDLSFDKPYLFLVHDKDSGEVWFTGAVYEPKPAVEE